MNRSAAMYTVTEYQYQQLRNRYPSDEVVLEVGRQPQNTKELDTMPNTGSPKLPCFTDWSVFAASQGMSPAQAHEVHAWFVRQLREDAT